jgi:hypothetical protein
MPFPVLEKYDVESDGMDGWMDGWMARDVLGKIR